MSRGHLLRPFFISAAFRRYGDVCVSDTNGGTGIRNCLKIAPCPTSDVGALREAPDLGRFTNRPYRSRDEIAGFETVSSCLSI